MKLILQIFITIAVLTNCSSIKKSEPTKEPTKSVPESLFIKALQEQTEGAFLNARKLWNEFITHHPGLPGYEQAHYNLALCEFHLGQPQQAIAPLQAILESPSNLELAIEARILLGESLLKTSAFEEALSLTFEVFPDAEAERRVGLKRFLKTNPKSKMTFHPTLSQQIRLMLLRGKIWVQLQNTKEAHEALLKARKNLEKWDAASVPTPELQRLWALWAWQMMESTGLSCKSKNPVPARLSESEFLDYSTAYYRCVSEIQNLYCRIVETQDEQIRSQVTPTYKALVEEPLKLLDPLPPPARQLKGDLEQKHYEAEMKLLIKTTVTKHSKEYQSLKQCAVENILW